MKFANGRSCTATPTIPSSARFRAASWFVACVLSVASATAQINPQVLGSYSTGVFDESAAEIVQFDPVSQRLFVVNADSGKLDIIDITNPTRPSFVQSVEFPGGGINSVAIKNGVVAVAIEAAEKTDPGSVAFLNADGVVYATVEAGALPDMVTFTHDGRKVLVANEGEPNDEYTVDPVGSVTLVDLGRGTPADLWALSSANVTQIGFDAYNDRKASLLNKGVRIFGPNASVAQDLEPEYITVAPGDELAYVALQENNALAVIDIPDATVKDILPLGTKDHSRGLPSLTEYIFEESALPILGISTADNSTPVLLGGMSGLWHAISESTPTTKIFYAVPDRGPNGSAINVDGVTHREFLIPDYQARVVKFSLNILTSQLQVDQQILFTRKDGTTPITGIPNIPGFDEVPLNGAGEAVDYDPYGADMEGVLIDPDDGTFWTVDEYRPAIYNFAANGTLIERYVPQGTSLLGTTPQAAGFYGAETLPAEYSNRRANRGFEAVALDTTNDILYAFIQTPMDNPDSSIRNSDVIRILGIDPADGTPVAEYVYLLERNADSGHGFARTDKLGDAVYIENNRFYVLERDSSDRNDGTTGHKYVFEIDLTGATNLLASGAPSPLDGKTLEQHSAEDLVAAGIQPVYKSKVLNLPSIGYIPTDKPEGLALMLDGSLAVISDNDFTQGGFSDVSLGIIGFDQPNGLDASNRDDAINITNWPVHGLFMPDSIASFAAGGQTYIITANEGDSRDYDGFSEEERIKDLTLDATRFPNADSLQEDENLGRLKTTSTLGDLDGDGDYDRLFSYGARSFSIFDQFGNLVFDSGEQFEQTTAAAIPAYFNSSNDETGFDDRSDDKGPEPEAVEIGTVDGVPYAFIGLERVGGVMVYDLSDPTAPQYVIYITNRDFSADPESSAAGDLGPEGLKFIGAGESPNGLPLLVVSNEVSGTTTVVGLARNDIAAPSNVAAVQDASGAVTVSWQDNASDETAYWIQRAVLGSSLWTTVGVTPTNDTSFRDAFATTGNYHYRVIAKSGDAASTPVASGPARKFLDLGVIGSYTSNVFDESAAEINAYDPASQRVFVVNANSATIDVLDASNPANPTLVVSETFPGGGVNSVAVKDGIVAVAVEAENKQDNGYIAILNTDGDWYASVPAGALPDMVTFTPDGTKILAANEGEPNDDYTVDPEGSVTIIDLGDRSPATLSGLGASDATQVRFTAFNDQRDSLLNKGVRIYGPNATVAQDLEPEYIAVAPAGDIAYVALQENNALAVIDIAAGTATDILPLGYKDHSRGLPQLTEHLFDEDDLPTLGISTADDSTPVLLGGLSGLWHEISESTATSKIFYAVPDRGPNGSAINVDGVTNREFLIPDYQARAVKFELNTTSGELSVLDQILFTRKDGSTPITGIPNIPGYDEVPLNGKGEAIDYDAYGADMEGVLINPDDGTFWTVDEYRPAIYNFAADGTLIERYVPEGTSLLGDTPQAAGFYGAETLPAEYSNRRANRGFEAVALDTDNDIVYAFIQTPMDNPDNSIRNSDVIRILGVNPADGTPVAEYVYLLERNAQSGHGFARTDKLGDAVYAGDNRFYVMERDSSDRNDGTTGHKYVFEIDLAGATNLLAAGAPSPLADKTLEQHSAADLAAVGIRPVFKHKVLNLPSIGYIPTDKPEGLALLADGSMAVMSDNDFTQGGFSDVSLGIISFSQSNGLDASNRDDAINITNWPVYGMFQPDAIGAYAVNGQTYIVTANEGDSRDYDGFSEEERIGDFDLDATRFPNAESLLENENLGRLKTTTTLGDLDGDGDYDRLFSYGGRSFSIFDQFGNLVFDSGDEFERVTAELIPADFNSSNDENDGFDNRSDDKGPEPEALAIGWIDGRPFAFIGLERVGGVMVYDISNPTAPQFVDYLNNRDFAGDAAAGSARDLGPEGMTFVSAADSPTRAPMLVVSNEVSGSTTLYNLAGISVSAPTSVMAWAGASGEVNISWTDASSNESGFVVQRRAHDGLWRDVGTVGAGSTRFVDRSAAASVAYDYRVIAIAGDSASLAVNADMSVMTPIEPEGIYFGTWGGAGQFALFVRENGTGVFIGHSGSAVSLEVPLGNGSIFNLNVEIAGDGSFSFNSTSDNMAVFEGFSAAAGVEGRISGATISGEVHGGVIDPFLLTGSRTPANGHTAEYAGFYQGVLATAGDGVLYQIVSADGRSMVFASDGENRAGGIGTVNGSGTTSLATSDGVVIRLTAAGEGVGSGELVTPDGVVMPIYAFEEGEGGNERLTNSSTRALASTGDSIIIQGFSVAGSGSAPLLVRGVGPALAEFGVSDVLADPTLEVFSGSTLVSSNDNWSDAANAADVAATSQALGTFALADGSADSALLLNLAPGNYTAHLQGADGGSGIGLVEIYTPNDEEGGGLELVNLSTRNEVGSAGDELIMGFIVAGEIPKKHLIRVAGPGLAQFGVDGVLADPNLEIYRGDMRLTGNDNWENSPADISAANTAAGAFQFDPGSTDSAIVVWLEPGAYTAVASGVNDATGVALIEIFELD